MELKKNKMENGDERGLKEMDSVDTHTGRNAE